MTTPPPPAVAFVGVSKSFNGVLANSDLTFSVERGTLHAIVGENGAGKSTAMKLLYGMLLPDMGEIRVHGRPVRWSSPAQAIAAGVGMVHQHFMLGEPFSVLDNILLGAEPTLGAARALPAFLQPVRSGAARARIDSLARRYACPVDLDARVADLSVGEQQRVEILKLLYREAGILILDEPTAVLTPQEIDAFYANLHRLKDEGKTILVITHKLKEVCAHTDAVTVLRHGRVVATRATSTLSEQALADLMVGRSVNLRVPLGPAKSDLAAPPALRVRGLTLGATARQRQARATLRDLNFDVGRGEIVGIAGVEGNGQSALLQLLLSPASHFAPHPLQVGAAQRAQGSLEILGTDARMLSTRRIKALGVGFVPEDRHHQGLMLGRSVADNFVLGLEHKKEFSTWGILSKRKIHAFARAAMEDYDVRPRDVDLVAGALSGGNQQKIIIARELSAAPKLLVAAQPTRGVDVGAIEFIHARIVAARDAGAGVLLVSSELDEILALSDRLLVMCGGEIVARFARGSFDERAIGLHMGGARQPDEQRARSGGGLS